MQQEWGVFVSNNRWNKHLLLGDYLFNNSWCKNRNTKSEDVGGWSVGGGWDDPLQFSVHPLHAPTRPHSLSTWEIESFRFLFFFCFGYVMVTPSQTNCPCDMYILMKRDMRAKLFFFCQICGFMCSYKSINNQRSWRSKIFLNQVVIAQWLAWRLVPGRSRVLILVRARIY